jgi:hypothetical protein
MGRNPLLLCAYHALSMALFPVAVFTLFWRDDLGLDMTQIMIVQAIRRRRRRPRVPVRLSR